MAVYVDGIVTYGAGQVEPAARQHGTRWSHLTADSDDELHAFAARLGLRRAYFQDARRPALRHYDVTPGKRALAVRLGAVEVDAREHLSARIAREVVVEEGWLVVKLVREGEA